MNDALLAEALRTCQQNFLNSSQRFTRKHGKKECGTATNELLKIENNYELQRGGVGRGLGVALNVSGC